MNATLVILVNLDKYFGFTLLGVQVYFIMMPVINWIRCVIKFLFYIYLLQDKPFIGRLFWRFP